MSTLCAKVIISTTSNSESTQRDKGEGVTREKVLPSSEQQNRDKQVGEAANT